MKMIDFLAQLCYYAQTHISDGDAWDQDYSDRENRLQCVSHAVSCFLAQNTKEGDNGVEWEVVLNDLVVAPKQDYNQFYYTVDDWKQIISEKIELYGGLK